MRTAALTALLSLTCLAQEPQNPPAEEPAPVDVAKVLRESPEFAATCKRFKIEWKEGLVTATGEIAYRGGGPCEFLINVSPAKAHETIVLLDSGPWTDEKRRPPPKRLDGYATCLNNALLCAGFKQGKPFSWNEETQEVFPPEGEVVHVYVEWKDGEKEIRARISDMLWNFRTLDVMQPNKLVYTGSQMIDEGPPNHKKWFGAEVDRLLVAVWCTSTSLIDNTEEGGTEGNCYEAIPDRVPEVGTRVTVRFSKKPLENVTEFEPLKLPDEVLEERKRRAEEKAKEEKGPGEEK